LQSEPIKLEAQLVFPDLEDGLVEKISTKVTVGSEIGELIIEDESLSPRHCTFINNNKTICLMDHSSIAGTFINKKRLEPGRTFILGENDKILIGKLSVRVEFIETPSLEALTEAEDAVSKDDPSEVELKAATQSIDVDHLLAGSAGEGNEQSTQQEVDTQADDAAEAQEDITRFFEQEQEEIVDLNSSDVEQVELDSEVLKAYENSKVGKRKSRSLSSPKKKLVDSKKNKRPSNASHVLFRLLALVVDALVCLTILNVFYVFTDFQFIYDEVPKVFLSFVEAPYLEFVHPLIEEILNKNFPQLKSIDQIYDFVAFFLLLFTFRVVGTFLLGVSVGGALLGMKSFGTGLKKRFLGVFRELIGFFTTPFLVFDLPTLISKRSLKEVLTKTHLYNPSLFNSILLTIFVLPLFTFSYLVSPIVKGLEILPKIPVTEVSRKLKPWSYSNKVHSSLLNMNYDLSGSMISLPAFQIEIENKKRLLKFGIVLVNKDTGDLIELKVIKKFSTLSLFKDFVRFNLLSEIFQPEIYAFVNDVSLENKNFKKKTKLENKQLALETKNLLSATFSLDFDNLYSFVMEQGPMLMGFRDFREKVERLVEDKIQNIQTGKFGNKEGALFTHQRGKSTWYSFIPLSSSPGYVYRTSQNIHSAKWGPHVRSVEFSAGKSTAKMDNADLFMQGFKKDISFENYQLAQTIYERYYLVGKVMLEKNNEKNIITLMTNINKLKRVLEENRLKNKKLYLNLSEILNALEKRNFKFFNIRKTVTV
jgi:pSer/pThr/pTyr-binding forkhead associated (FHA) protein